MMVQLTHNGKTLYLQFSAILFMKKRFFFKGSKIGMVGGYTVYADQDPDTIIASVSGAGAKAAPTKKTDIGDATSK